MSDSLDFDSAQRCGVRLTLSEWMALDDAEREALTEAADALWLRRACLAELVRRLPTSDLLVKVDPEAAADFELMEATARASKARTEAS